MTNWQRVTCSTLRHLLAKYMTNVLHGRRCQNVMSKPFKDGVIVQMPRAGNRNLWVHMSGVESGGSLGRLEAGSKVNYQLFPATSRQQQTTNVRVRLRGLRVAWQQFRANNEYNRSTVYLTKLHIDTLTQSFQTFAYCWLRFRVPERVTLPRSPPFLVLLMKY